MVMNNREPPFSVHEVSRASFSSPQRLTRRHILELAGVTLIGAHCTLDVALVAIGAVDLLTQDRATAQRGEHAALRIARVVGSGGAVSRADQVARDGVVIGLAGGGRYSSAGIAPLFRLCNNQAFTNRTEIRQQKNANRPKGHFLYLFDSIISYVSLYRKSTL